MATTAKIAKQDSRLAALAHAKETKTMVKFPPRIATAAFSVDGRADSCASSTLPDLFPETGAGG